MKIVYYSKPYFADCDFPLIKELRRQGHTVIYILVITPDSLKSTLFNIEQQYSQYGIFTPDIYYDELSLYSSFMELNDMYILNKPLSRRGIIEKIKFIFQLRKFIKAFNADYIWTTLPFDVGELPLYSLKNVILTVHDPFPHSGEYQFRKSVLKALALRMCKKFILLNKTQEELFSKSYHIDKFSILVNQLGTYDCIKLFLKEKSTELFPYILFYGRISPYKGIEYLLEAFKKVHDNYPGLNLLIAGSGQLYFDYTPYADLNYIKLKNRYISMEETANLFNNSLFIVCPYTDATQSGVVMTAYTMGKVVLGTRVGALEETIINNETGLIVEPCNVDELYKAIIKLISDEKLLSKMENNIKMKYSNGNASWASIVDKYISFLNK